MEPKNVKTVVLLFGLWVGLAVVAPGVTASPGKDIHHMAKKGDVKRIKLLLKQEPQSVNLKDRFGWTPLQMAALHSRREVVRLLLQRGAQVNWADKFGLTALHLAAIRGDNAIFELLVKNGATVKPGSTVAPIQDRLFTTEDIPVELTQLLLDKTFFKRLNGKRKMGKSSAPPSSAFTIMSLYEELIEVSLMRTYKKSKDGGSTLSLAPRAMNRLKKLAEDIISRRMNAGDKTNTGSTRLHEAARDGDAAKVTQLLRARPGDVRTRNNFGITALHYAAIGGHQEIAAQLLAAGANVNEGTQTGITPLYGAVSEGKAEMVRFLIRNGADVNAATTEGAVPLHAATDKVMAQLLVNAGAKVKARNNYGFTPLHIAAHYGYIDMAEYLLSKGAELDSRTDTGWTPLCEAVYHKETEMVRFLVSRGANVNVRTPVGSTPLRIANRLMYIEIAAILKQHGAF